MAKESFRFIHASDFHLESPMQDIYRSARASSADHWLKLRGKRRKPFLSTPCSKTWTLSFSSRRLMLNLSTAGAPRRAAFLLEQFEMLRQRGIDVYWAGGAVDDPERWPEAVVATRQCSCVFERHEVESVCLSAATKFGLGHHSWDAVTTIRVRQFGLPSIATEPEENYVVAVAHGKGDA